MEPDKLLQAQAELAGLLRDPIRDAAALLRAREALSTHCAFITHLSRVAGRRMGMPLETVFQCLMQMSADSGSSGGGAPPVDFDLQHRDGAVPMHQAKVLRRDSAREVEPLLREAVKETDEWNLPMLISHSVSLRTLLRIKVEDGNDLSMARRAITQADDYMTTIFNLSSGDVEKMWLIFSAADERQLAAVIGHATLGGFASQGGAEGGSSDAITVRPLPRDLARGIEDECREGLAGGAAVPVGTRQRSLADIDAWLRQRGPFTDTEARAIFAAPSFRAGMHYHLAEKRSALLRAACDILSLLLARSPDAALASDEAVAALTSWAAQLMSQVHVTVAAIATATDCAMRDIIVATGGACVPIVSTVAAAMMRGVQPELHRKALGYGALALVAGSAAQNAGSSSSSSPARSFTATRAGAAVLDAVMAMLPKGLGSSTEAVRRNARVAGLVAQKVSGAQGDTTPVTMPPQWDARVEKAAAALIGVVEGALSSRTVATFETDVLLYTSACPIALVLGGLAPVPVPETRTSSAPAAVAPAPAVSHGVVSPPPVAPLAVGDINPDAAVSVASTRRAAPTLTATTNTTATVVSTTAATTTATASVVAPRRVPFNREAVMAARGLPVGGIALAAGSAFEPVTVSNAPSHPSARGSVGPTPTAHGGTFNNSTTSSHTGSSARCSASQPSSGQHGGSVCRSPGHHHRSGGASLTPLSSPSVLSPQPVAPPSIVATQRLQQPLSQPQPHQRSPPQHFYPPPPSGGSGGNTSSSNGHTYSTTSPPHYQQLQQQHQQFTRSSVGVNGARRSESKTTNTLMELDGTGGGSGRVPSGRCDSSRTSYLDGDAAASPSVASASAASSSQPSSSTTTGAPPFSASSRSLGSTTRGVPLSLASLDDAAPVAPTAAPPRSSAAPIGLSGSLRRRLQESQPSANY